MLHTKSINEITYKDIVDFCNQQIRESIHLDYKREISPSIAKTIAAMGNTWGGLIVIGVDDEDSKPKLPIQGMPTEEHIEEKINNIILGNITPPIFPEIAVCRSDDQTRVLMVIRIHQSDLVHATQGNSKVYIRTNTSNEPEELADLNRLQWLLNKRQKSEDLKMGFYDIADKRYQGLSEKNGIIQNFPTLTFSICPKYPFEVLIDYRRLRDDVPNKISVNVQGVRFPFILNSHQFIPAQNGVYGFIPSLSSEYIVYEELNHFGLLFLKERLRLARENENTNNNIIYFHQILTHLNAFTRSAKEYFKLLGYWGLLELRLDFHNLSGVKIGNLPAPRGKYYMERIIVSPIDQSVSINKTISSTELADKQEDIVAKAIEDMSWAFGFTHITTEAVLKLLEELGER